MLIVGAILSVAFNVAGALIAGRAYGLDWRGHRDEPLIPRPRRWPGGRDRQVAFSDAVTAIEVITVARGTVSPSPNATTEDLVAWLLRDLALLREQFDDAKEASESESRLVEGRFAGIERNAEAMRAEVERLTTDAVTGTLRLQLLGLVLIGIGTTIGGLVAVASLWS